MFFSEVSVRRLEFSLPPILLSIFFNQLQLIIIQVSFFVLSLSSPPLTYLLITSPGTRFLSRCLPTSSTCHTFTLS